jgi:hypothetical protein
MGQLADALRANLRTVAESDARALRQIDQQLKATCNGVDAKALLGAGSFKAQTIATLKRLCKENGIKGFSKMNKTELCRVLQASGVQPPPAPLESFSKKELVAMLKKLLAMP